MSDYIYISCRLQQERDTAEKESRDKETKILNLNRELEELRDRLEQVERQKNAQQRELEDLVSSKDDVGKNVSQIETVQALIRLLPKEPYAPGLHHLQ